MLSFFEPFSFLEMQAGRHVQSGSPNKHVDIGNFDAEVSRRFVIYSGQDQMH